jgi:anthranilate phosphoribosyltransferase
MDSFKPYLAKVATGAALTREEARDAFDDLLSGEVTHSQGGAFLMALRVRGEALDEIAGAVSAMRGRMLKVKAPERAIDIVGTGGDHSGSYNISTLAAIIVAAAAFPWPSTATGPPPPAPARRTCWRRSGVKLGLDPAGLERCLQEAGLCFMFAQTHHAAMRHVAPVRVELGTRTIFNLLGPLSNPPGVATSCWVFSRGLARSLTQFLKDPRLQEGLGPCTARRARRDDHHRADPWWRPLENAQSAGFTVTPDEVACRPRAPRN